MVADLSFGIEALTTLRTCEPTTKRIQCMTYGILKTENKKVFLKNPKEEQGTKICLGYNDKIKHCDISFKILSQEIYRVKNLKFVRNLKFAASKTLVNSMKKRMLCLKTLYILVQIALINYTFNKSHLNSFILLVFPHVANFRYVANFRFLTLYNPSPEA